LLSLFSHYPAGVPRSIVGCVEKPMHEEDAMRPGPPDGESEEPRDGGRVSG
jgi:hypothetical protein